MNFVTAWPKLIWFWTNFAGINKEFLLNKKYWVVPLTFWFKNFEDKKLSKIFSIGSTVQL